MALKYLALACLASCAAADIVFSRTVSDLVSGASGTVTVGPAGSCAASDEFGSNDCTLNWGSNYTANIDANLPVALDASSKINVDLTVDGLLPLSVSCVACGAECSFTIPVIGMDVTIPALPCPLAAAGALKQVVDVPLPAMSPAPLRVTVSGTVTLVDGTGATLGVLGVDATLSP